MYVAPIIGLRWQKIKNMANHNEQIQHGRNKEGEERISKPEGSPSLNERIGDEESNNLNTETRPTFLNESRLKRLKRDILNENIEDQGRDETVYPQSSRRRLDHGFGFKIDGVDVYTDKNGKPLNPYWEKQASLLSAREKTIDNAFGGIYRGYRKVKNFLKPLSFDNNLNRKENPDAETRKFNKYEKMVKDGHAEFFQDLPLPINKKEKGKRGEPDLRVYRLMKKAYQRAKIQSGRLKAVGIYDNEDRLVGMRIYLIKQ